MKGKRGWYKTRYPCPDDCGRSLYTHARGFTEDFLCLQCNELFDHDYIIEKYINKQDNNTNKTSKGDKVG